MKQIEGQRIDNAVAISNIKYLIKARKLLVDNLVGTFENEKAYAKLERAFSQAIKAEADTIKQ